MLISFFSPRNATAITKSEVTLGGMSLNAAKLTLNSKKKFERTRQGRCYAVTRPRRQLINRNRTVVHYFLFLIHLLPLLLVLVSSIAFVAAAQRNDKMHENNGNTRRGASLVNQISTTL